MTLLLDDIPVEIIRKNIRTIRINVTPEGKVICSASRRATDSKIEEFVRSKEKWIKKAVERVKAASQNNETLRPDGIAALSGFTTADRIKNGRNFIYSKKWKEQAMKNFEHTVCRFMPCFDVGLLPAFDLKARSMHSMWGNCNTRTKVITLNWELFNFPQVCIDYVVLHEMTHFLYIHHDAKFYGYIQRFMPDYKAYVKMMK